MFQTTNQLDITIWKFHYRHALWWSHWSNTERLWYLWSWVPTAKSMQSHARQILLTMFITNKTLEMQNTSDATTSPNDTNGDTNGCYAFLVANICFSSKSIQQMHGRIIWRSESWTWIYRKNDENWQWIDGFLTCGFHLFFAWPNAQIWPNSGGFMGSDPAIHKLQAIAAGKFVSMIFSAINLRLSPGFSNASLFHDNDEKHQTLNHRTIEGVRCMQAHVKNRLLSCRWGPSKQSIHGLISP